MFLPVHTSFTRGRERAHPHHTEGESLSAEDIALPTATEGREPGLASMGTIWTWRRWTSSLPTLLPSLRGWMVDAQQYHVPRGVCKKSNNSSRTPCALRPFAVVARGRLAYSKSRHLMRFHVCSASTASTGASRYDHALRFMMVGGIVSGADPSQTAQGSGGDAATMRACVCARSSTVSAGQVAAVQRLGRLLLVLRARVCGT